MFAVDIFPTIIITKPGKVIVLALSKKALQAFHLELKISRLQLDLVHHGDMRLLQGSFGRASHSLT